MGALMRTVKLKRRNSGAQPWASNEEYEAWKTRRRQEDRAAARTATERLSVQYGGGPRDRAELSIGWGGVGAAGQALRFGTAYWRLSGLPERFYYAAPIQEGQEAIAAYILDNRVPPTRGNPGKPAAARKKRGARSNPAKPKGTPIAGHPGWRGFVEYSPGRFVEYRKASSPRKGCMVRTDRVDGARKLHFAASRYGEKAGWGSDGFLSLGHFDSREAAFAACERSEGGHAARERGMGGHLMTTWQMPKAKANPLGADAYGFTQGFLQGHAEWGTPTPDEMRRAMDPYAVGYRKGRHAAGTSAPADAATADRYYRGELGAHINPRGAHPGWTKHPTGLVGYTSTYQHDKSSGFVAKKGRYWYGFSAGGAPAVAAAGGLAFQSIGAAMRAVAAGYFRKGT